MVMSTKAIGKTTEHMGKACIDTTTVQLIQAFGNWTDSMATDKNCGQMVLSTRATTSMA